MNLLDQLKSIDPEKIKDEDIQKELKEAIDLYDERMPISLANAELVLEMIRDTFPKAINVEEKESVGEQITETEAKKVIKAGKVVVAETPGGETYTVENAQEVKEAVKKDHELKIEKVGKKNGLKAKGSSKENKVKVKNLQKEIAVDKEKEVKEASSDSTTEVVKEKQLVQNENISAKKKITKENKGDCDKILSDIKALLEKHKTVKVASKHTKPNTPLKKKALSVLVKNSVISIVKRVVNREKNNKKKVDLKKLEAAIKKGKEFLIALRKASNGISDDNDQMIQSFEKQMKEIMTSFEQKKTV